MSRKRKLLTVVAAVAAAAALLAWWQRDNLRAGWLSARYSDAQLQDRLQANEEKTEKIIEGALPEGQTMGRLDDEERQALQDGALDPKEAVKRILERSGMSAEEAEKAAAGQAESAPDGAQETSPGTQTQQSGDGTDAAARIKVLIAQVYVMRDSFVARLGAIRDAALAEYKALPASERTKTKKMELAGRCIDQAGALEADCDSQVDAVLSELTQLLKSTGGDMSLVSEIREVYANEKALKKADYLNTYFK